MAWWTPMCVSFCPFWGRAERARAHHGLRDGQTHTSQSTNTQSRLGNEAVVWIDELFAALIRLCKFEGACIDPHGTAIFDFLDSDDYLQPGYTGISNGVRIVCNI